MTRRLSPVLVTAINSRAHKLAASHYSAYQQELEALAADLSYAGRSLADVLAAIDEHGKPAPAAPTTRAREGLPSRAPLPHLSRKRPNRDER